MKQKDGVKQLACDAVSQKEKAVITQLEEVASMQAEQVSMKELTDAVKQTRALIKKHYLQRNK